MSESRKAYFVSDVHLGLRLGDPAEREARFVSFLKTLSGGNVSVLYLLGDIWDFWYEYHDVVPREGARVVAQLVRLMDEGVDVVFFPGNHDIWTYSFFESLGIRVVRCQPLYEEVCGRAFCLAHGDGLGGSKRSYRMMSALFHNKVAQALFSTLHPRLAFAFGLRWSNSNRRTHAPYVFKGEDEPLYRFSVGQLRSRRVDYFVFGHFHVGVDMPLPSGPDESGRVPHLVVLKDWVDGGTPFACFDGEELKTSF